MDKFLKAVVFAVFALVMYIVLGVLFAWPTKWLVNYLFTPSVLKALFGVPHVDLWRAFALDVLCCTLFKGSAVTSK